MEKTFRAILNEYLDDVKPAPRAAVGAFSFAFEPLILPPPDIRHVAKTVPKNKAYADDRRRSRANAERARQPRPERIVVPIMLDGADLADLNRLVELGGIELKEGLSAKRLKTAYRRLARMHHPDVTRLDHARTVSAHEVFLELNAAYGRLTARLKHYQI